MQYIYREMVNKRLSLWMALCCFACMLSLLSHTNAMAKTMGGHSGVPEIKVISGGGGTCQSTYLTANIQQGDSLFGCFNRINLLGGFDSLAMAYLWSNGETTSEIQVTTSGTYSLVVFDSLGCTDTAYTYVSIGLTEVDIDSLMPDTVVICIGGEATLNAFHPSIQAWQWSTTETTSEILVSEIGTYTVIVYDQTVCSDTADIYLYPSLTNVELDSVVSDTFYYCIGDTFHLDISNPEVYAYLWSDGSTESSISLNAPGLFNIIIYDGLVCTDTAWFRLLESDPQLNAGEDTVACGGVPVVLTAQGPFVDWSWSTGTSANSISVISPGEYIVVAYDANGCYDWDSVQVGFHPVTPIPTITDEGATLTSSEGASFQWYLEGAPINGANQPSYDPMVAGNYMVEVWDENGCNAMSMPYYFFSKAIPEGISPNGDNLNDIWVIPTNNDFPDNHLQILSRWGTVVYDRAPYENDFRGLSDSGGELPDGTYFYVYDKGNGEEPIQGILVINR